MLNSTETWRPVVGYEGDYEVSDHGRVRVVKEGRKRVRPVGSILPQFVQSTGRYKTVHLYKDNKGLTVRVHRLVALAFIPNPDNKPQVNHKDSDWSNNHVSNLEWVTASENRKHAYDAGRVSVMTVLGRQFNGSSTYRYVYWDSNRNKWTAGMKIDGKMHNVGRFNTEIEAAKAAYDYLDLIGDTTRIRNHL